MQYIKEKEASVKYTTVLPRECLNALKDLTDKKCIPSVSQGIRWAIDEFVYAKRRQAYELSMKSAATDEEFVKRTMEAHCDFTAVDEEGEAAW